jgi:hypothetical protein
VQQKVYEGTLSAAEGSRRNIARGRGFKKELGVQQRFQEGKLCEPEGPLESLVIRKGTIVFSRR